MKRKLLPLASIMLILTMITAGTVGAAGEASLLIDKTVDYDGDGVYTDSESNYPGNTASWKVVVTNNSTMDIDNVTVTDTNGHDFGAVFNLNGGESKTFVYSTVVDVDTINIASAQGEFISQPFPVPAVEDDAEALVVPVVGANAQFINKTNILAPWLVIAALIVIVYGSWFLLKRYL